VLQKGHEIMGWIDLLAAEDASIAGAPIRTFSLDFNSLWKLSKPADALLTHHSDARAKARK
jgi:hypothetical protein